MEINRSSLPSQNAIFRTMNKIIFPPSLKAGNKIGIVSTARKISLEEIQPAVEIIRGWGLEVVTGKTIGKESFQFAGTDEERIADFQQMLDDASIHAIICARGGYGTVRIIDELDFRDFQRTPKWICGFSDVTVLHSHLLNVFHCVSLHCSMPVSFPTNTTESLESIRKVLFGEILKYEIPANDFNRAGETEGIVCGGNLSILYSLSGSVSDIDTTDKILFIEDIDEHLYHIDRMMMQLKRSGKLENLSGLIIGHFSKMKNLDESNPFGKNAYEIIAGAVSEYDYPVCYGFPAGHEPDNCSLIIGEKVKLTVTDNRTEINFNAF